jgi:hypothetical protein
MTPSLLHRAILSRRARTGAFTIVALASALSVVACGASRQAPESKSGDQQQQAPYAAPPAGAAAGQPAPESAPAPSSADEAPASRSMESDAPSSTEREKSYAYVDDIDALSRSLDRTLRLSVPDCTSAASLRDRICDLAQRICSIAARSADDEVEGRCSDGKKRCERATASVRSTCPE